MWACAGGHADVVKLLLNNGADVSKRKQDGKSAVDIAAFKKHHQVTIIHNFINILYKYKYIKWWKSSLNREFGSRLR